MKAVTWVFVWLKACTRSVIEDVYKMSSAKYRVVETKDVEGGNGGEELKEKKSPWTISEEQLCITRITPLVPIEGRHVLVRLYTFRAGGE